MVSMAADVRRTTMFWSETLPLPFFVLVLTWTRTYKLRKIAAEAKIQTRLSTLLLRDGTVYFVAILAMDIVGIVIDNNSSVSQSVGSTLTIIEDMMQCMLLSRFMFGLREAYLCDQSGGTSHAIGSHAWSSVRFTAPNIMGNIGAPLTDGDSLDELSADADGDREYPTPVVCDDPFAVGLIREDIVEMTALRRRSDSKFSDREPAADETRAVESRVV